MALRDLIADDLGTILADSDEFGGTVTVDGVEVPGSLQANARAAAPRASAGRSVDGVYAAERVLYLSEASLALLPKAPVVDGRLVVDGKTWRVAALPDRDMGLVTIRLAWWEG